jgi:hypothetical protein
MNVSDRTPSLRRGSGYEEGEGDTKRRSQEKQPDAHLQNPFPLITTI